MKKTIALGLMLLLAAASVHAQQLVNPGGGNQLVSGPFGSIVVGAPISGAPCSSGQVVYNNAGVVGCRVAVAEPSGPAGGDLSGTYPNPTVAKVGGVTPGTGVTTAFGVNVGSAGAVVVNGGALGTPSSGVVTNLTGTASGLTAGTVTTNANLTGDVTSAGNATTLASVITAGGPIGSATVAPIVTYDAKGRLTAVTSATVTPAVDSITGFGTGVGTALAVNVGSAGAVVLNVVWANFTPTISCAVGAVGAYSAQTGRYSRIGTTVVFSLNVQAAVGTCTGSLSIAGFPVNNAGTSDTFMVYNATTGSTGGCLFNGTGTSTCSMTNSVGADFVGSNRFVVTGTYEGA